MVECCIPGRWFVPRLIRLPVEFAKVNKALLLAVLATLAPAAFAGEPALTDSGRQFQQLDANGDCWLEAGEIPQEKRTLFERLVRLGDGDADGKPLGR
jgi:hypothetical protein